MAEIKLPFEVKRLIYDYADLPTIKSLRLASQDWAAVGIELLFLPTFIIKSPSKDLSRLKSIGTRQAIADQAAKTIRTLNFWSNDWHPIYLRSIVCSRHVHLRTYEPLSFVPTQEEQAALSELDGLIQVRQADVAAGESIATLTAAFKQIPHAQTLNITSPNSFKHPILRKVWDEYNMETYREPYLRAGAGRLLNIFSAATEAGLSITKVHHEAFHEDFFFDESHAPVAWDFSSLTKNLRSLTLDIDDIFQSLSEAMRLAFRADSNTITDHNATTITSTSPTESEETITLPQTLTSLTLNLESLDHLALELQPTPASNLHTLCLVGISITPSNFLPFITNHAPALRRLHLGSVELRVRTTDGFGYDWETFLTSLRDSIGLSNGPGNENGKRLEKFQLSGVVKATGANSPTWMLWKIYKTESEEWEERPWRVEMERGREVEAFVIGGGEWPMGVEDDLRDVLA